ncbi:hypothetical protein BT63DRAFT_418505 [Microthyrium microscopicum]|uniref:Uncharacterized protein n=1 Tax=Microthyrium microscopicum TaxID=703497 RepID=A0A6A6U0E8_9PEZI|nr:hypothetical protein BT63DRAFT_418505 [Microthyrium microscopicum]
MKLNVTATKTALSPIKSTNPASSMKLNVATPKAGFNASKHHDINVTQPDPGTYYSQPCLTAWYALHDHDPPHDYCERLLESSAASKPQVNLVVAMVALVVLLWALLDVLPSGATTRKKAARN